MSSQTVATVSQGDVLDMADVAALTTISVATLERMLSMGKLPKPMRLGRSRRWTRAEIVAWMEAQRG